MEQYKGTGEPPHCEMIVKAAAEDVTPSDLSFTASFNGLQNSLTIEDSHCFEVQNVVECSAQVFYYNVKVNWWKAIIAFFPTEQQKVGCMHAIAAHAFTCISSFLFIKTASGTDLSGCKHWSTSTIEFQWWQNFY